jgi:hypothetical protein
MRINDLKKKETVNEIDLVGAVKGAAQGWQQSQQQRQTAQNTKLLAQAALRQWSNKVMQLNQAAQGQPVDNQQYEAQLADFVERTLLRGAGITDLDDPSETKIEAAIGAVLAARNNPKTLPQAFENLVSQTVVARMDPNKYKAGTAPQAAAGAAPGAAGAAPGAAPVNLSPAQADAEIKRILNLSNLNTANFSQALQGLAGGAITVSRTTSPVVNALLTQLGIAVK